MEFDETYFNLDFFLYWLDYKKDVSNEEGNKIFDCLRSFKKNFCDRIGDNITHTKNRGISVPYSINFNFFAWIQDSFNRFDFEGCEKIIKIISWIFKWLDFEVNYDTEEYDKRERFDMLDEYKPQKKSFNDFYYDLIVSDIFSILPIIRSDISQAGNFPDKGTLIEWKKSWKLYCEFINWYKWHYERFTQEIKFFDNSDINFENISEDGEYQDSKSFEEDVYNHFCDLIEEE